MNVEAYPRVAAAVKWERLLSAEVAAAEETQFSLLVERRSRFVFRVAYALVHRVEDAEDVVQEVFLKLFRTGAWRDIDDEKAFLARITWRAAVARRRKIYHEVPDMSANDRSPESSAIEADWVRTVQNFMDALPEKLRQPLALASIEEMNTREIAAALSIPEGTVRTRILRARQILREKLERQRRSLP
jgi:RNA polymerase sigma-70 factor, ECF subfamily